MLRKVVSGGQTGVDRAGLEAARAAGLSLGGWCPKGRLAEDGQIPGVFPLHETPEADYAVRTEWNVRDSDGTLILVSDTPVGGTALTIELAERYGRPCRVVTLPAEIDAALAWLRTQQIRILNVAGPRESTTPGIQGQATHFLERLFAALRAPGIARREERLSRFREADLYPVTCEKLSNGRTDEEVLEACLEGGVKLIQLRDKAADKATLYRKAVHFRRRTREEGVLLIINDHIDIAMAVDADGVHLGQDDFPIAQARVLIPDKLIGASTHSLAEARQAEAEGADTINIGPIFATRTKEGVGDGLGPAMIGQIAPQVNLPYTVMGGIKAHNLPEVIAAGARIAAVVTAVTQQVDMVKAVRDLRSIVLTQREQQS